MTTKFQRVTYNTSRLYWIPNMERASQRVEYRYNPDENLLEIFRDEYDLVEDFFAWWDEVGYDNYWKEHEE